MFVRLWHGHCKRVIQWEVLHKMWILAIEKNVQTTQVGPAHVSRRYQVTRSKLWLKDLRSTRHKACMNHMPRDIINCCIVLMWQLANIHLSLSWSWSYCGTHTMYIVICMSRLFVCCCFFISSSSFWKSPTVSSTKRAFRFSCWILVHIVENMQAWPLNELLFSTQTLTTDHVFVAFVGPCNSSYDQK